MYRHECVSSGRPSKEWKNRSFLLNTGLLFPANLTDAISSNLSILLAELMQL